LFVRAENVIDGYVSATSLVRDVVGQFVGAGEGQPEGVATLFYAYVGFDQAGIIRGGHIGNAVEGHTEASIGSKLALATAISTNAAVDPDIGLGIDLCAFRTITIPVYF
jgi:hypothetical protein